MLYYSSLLYPELKLYLSHSSSTPNINLFGWHFSNNRSKEKSANRQEMSTVQFRGKKGKVILNKNCDLLESKDYSYMDVQWGAGTISWTGDPGK